MSGVKNRRLTYEIDASRSVWRLQAGDMDIPALAGEHCTIQGMYVFNSDDARASWIQLWSANGWEHHFSNAPIEKDGSQPPGIRFLSWRFREIGQQEYWVPGALTIGDLTMIASLHVTGPGQETADARGNFRADATATTKIDASRVLLAFDEAQETENLTPGAQVTLNFQIELVRRMPAERGSAAHDNREGLRLSLSNGHS
jgi:hypothetical protein